MTPGIQGKVILVTGASRGIGKATAMLMAEEGARLAICARDENALTITADEIQARTKTDILAVKANLMKLNDIHRFVNAAVRKYGRIDTLVNNAGGAHIGGLFLTTDEEWEYHIQLKLLGYVRMAREVIPHMKLGGIGGKIINVVGTAGIEPSAAYMVPGVTNGALLNFTKSLSRELEPDRITINAVNPGTTETPLTAQTMISLAAILKKTPEEVRQSFVDQCPRGRLAAPEEVARAVLFLASEAASFINGISINIDAGKIAGIW